MNKIITLSWLLLLTGSGTYLKAQDKADAKAIKAMCGCHKVVFDFAETFAPDTAYQYKDRYHSEATEYIFVEEESEKKIVLQHLLIIRDTSVIKHWRQDWVYENTRFYEFEGNYRWKLLDVPADKVKGQWTQKVFEVMDAPRYSSSSRWIHGLSGIAYWEAFTPAPLPRREYTKRKDYQILNRTNRHQIEQWGHIHDQDNDKIIVNEDGSRTRLVSEKGYVTYTKVDDAACAVAVRWWEKHQEFWKASRDVWDDILGSGEVIYLPGNVSDMSVYLALSKLEKDYPKDPVALRKAIKDLLLSYLKHE